MLASLHSADAGRTQVTGVLALSEGVQAWMKQVSAMLAEVNQREMPVVETVAAAGGPADINSMSYYAEV
jgi:hypothetical protein